MKLGASAVGVGALSAITGMPQLTRVFAQTRSGGSATDWLQAAKWGVFNQGQMAEYQSPKITTISAWNTAVDNFDVDAARALRQSSFCF